MAIGYLSGSREAGDESAVTLHDSERAWQQVNFELVALNGRFKALRTELLADDNEQIRQVAEAGLQGELRPYMAPLAQAVKAKSLEGVRAARGSISTYVASPKGAFLEELIELSSVVSAVDRYINALTQD